ncbi:MAG: hypothetical protein AAF481_16830 [Acidobacteriota bacterium]
MTSTVPAWRAPGRVGVRRHPALLAAAICWLAALPGWAQEEAPRGEWSGFVAVEGRAFLNDPVFGRQDDGVQGSLVLEPEYQRDLARDGERLTFKPFLRLDTLDDDRSHFDIRELTWQKSGGRWQLLVGIGKVFWGVTESQHLVDIVNQTDLVENPDGEDKLGQPMVQWSLIRSWGILDLFVLPGFRERTFPSPEGRLSPALPVSDEALYESSAEESHVDFAARWSHAIGPLDFGLSHFTGTSREPRFLPRLRSDGDPELVPFYDQIDQTGLDLQATLGSWLLKLEAIHRSGQGEAFAAATAGFEYTLYGVFDTAADVGPVVEYLWDERGREGSPGDGLSPFQDDLFAGARVAFNDVQSSELLAGAILDLESDAALYLLEFSRRFGASWTVDAEVRVFDGLPLDDPLAGFAEDDHFLLRLARHF